MMNLKTPPMGWNSWYCYSESVSAELVLKQARALRDSGLAAHGWQYVCVDDCWQGERGGEFNAIQPNTRFGDMAALADEVHALGLKLGIYSTPWISTYAGFTGGSSDHADGRPDRAALSPELRYQPAQLYGRYPGLHERKLDRVGKHSFMEQDAKQWAKWGVDFVKLDWHLADPAPLAEARRALDNSGRDIVLSLSNSAPLTLAAEYARHAQMWRTTGDITDTWESINRIAFAQLDWQPHLRPGHYPDPDMLQVGRLGKTNAANRTFTPTRLTADEQRTQLILWSMLSAPLILSCDLTQLDTFTRRLLTDRRLLAINQDPAAHPARLVARDANSEHWLKPLADNTTAHALFNRSDREVNSLPPHASLLWRE